MTEASDFDGREIRYLGDVQRLKVQPGDVIVVSCPGAVSEEMAARLEQFVQAQIPGHRVLILGDGIKIGLVGTT